MSRQVPQAHLRKLAAIVKDLTPDLMEDEPLQDAIELLFFRITGLEKRQDSYDDYLDWLEQF